MVVAVVDQEPHLREQASEAQVAVLLGDPGAVLPRLERARPDQRRRMLERCVTDDAVLVDPTGRWEGVPGLAERIGR